LRIPTFFLIVLVLGAGDARRVRTGDTAEAELNTEVTCKTLLIGQYCPQATWILHAMVGKDESDWECMMKFAEEGKEACVTVKNQLMAEKDKLTPSSGFQASAEKISKFRSILGLEDLTLASPAAPQDSKKPWEKDLEAKAAPVVAAVVEAEGEPAAAGASSGECWCPHQARSAGHQGKTFEKKSMGDLFSFNEETKSGEPCTDCKECYKAMQGSTQVDACCGSNEEGKVDSTQCAAPFAMPNKEFEGQKCMCGGMSHNKATLWLGQSKKTCWPGTPCYAKPGKPQCCPA